MGDGGKHTESRSEEVAERKYAALKRAVEEAGFFAPRVIAEPGAEQLVCTSKFHGGDHYTGRIAFVAEVRGNWYIATPHPFHYRILDPARAAEAVVAFLAQGRNATLAEIDSHEYELAVSPAEPNAAADGRLGSVS